MELMARVWLRLGWLSVWLLAVGAAGAESSKSGAGHGLDVFLEAAWPSHRLWALLEAGEFLSGERLWELVDRAVSPAVSALLSGASSAEEARSASEAAALPLLPESDVLGRRLLQLSLDLRAFAPAVEQQRQLCNALWERVGGGAPGAPPPLAWAAVGSVGGAPPSVATSSAAVIEALARARTRGRSGSAASGTGVAANSDQGLDLLRPLDSDHVFASASGGGVVVDRVVVVLHGVPGSGEFAALHGALRDAALTDPTALTYVLRWCPSAADPLVSGRTKLAGFGASMDIKNMEYLTVDTDKQKEKAASGSPEAASEEEVQSDGGGGEGGGDGGGSAHRSNEVVQLSARELASLGLQAAQRVVASAEPLRTWADLACNLPSRAKQQLVGTRVAMDVLRLARQLDEHRSEFSAAGSILVNGIPVDAASESFNVFELVRSLREDAEMAAAAAAIELPGTCAGAGGPSGELVARLSDQFAASGLLEDPSADSEDQDALALAVVRQGGPRVDVKAGARGAVVFFNDVEKDTMYARWPRDLDALLQPVQRLIPVRKNLFTVIAAADPARAEDRVALNVLVQLVQQGAPIRLGVVFREVERPTGEQAGLANGECRAKCFVALFLEAIEAAGKEAGVKLLGALLRNSAPGPHSLSLAADEFARAIGKAGGEVGAQRLRERALAAARERKGADSTLAAMSDYVAKKGLPVPSWTLNGLVKRVTAAAMLQQELIQALMTEQRVMQYQVHFGKVTDDTNVLSYLLDAAAALPRYNDAIVRLNSESVFLAPIKAGSRARLLKAVPYLFRGGPGEALVTVWLLVGGKHGASEAVAAVLEAAEQAPDGVRLAVLPRSPGALDALPGAFWKAVANARPAAELRDALASPGAAASSSLPKDRPEELTRLAALGASLGGGLGGEDGQGSALVVNGRVIELGGSSTKGAGDPLLFATDIDLAVAYERQLRAEAVRSALAGCEGASADDAADTVVELTAHAGRRSKRPRRSLPSYLFDQPYAPLWLDTGAAAADDRASAGGAVDVTAVMDPLGEAAPRVSTVLLLLHEALGARVRVLLTPVPGLDKFPIATYFRFVGRGGAARFQAMPQEQLLTLKISTPEPWIVYPADTGGLDTDNVRLGALTKSAKVKFDLASLLVTGHCEETGAASPPAGLQLQLSSALGPRAKVRSDTLVMRNLGYLQLQAGPGVWRLATAPGASSELYEILPGTRDGGEGQHQQQQQQQHQQHALAKGEKLITIRDFCGQVERLETRKRPGREKEQLLDSLEEAVKGGGGGEGAAPQRKAAVKGPPQSVWEALQGALEEIVYGGTPPAPASANETIHVFSLASGALYERFLMLMCKTVTKASSQPIKVWIIENFLSPEFKRNIPVLAQHYGFSYALVTYKWPHWLRRQTEKQRIIWGYKILFLDVLFPLDVPKIIYIDSDQVVRADVAELWNMNLRGRPYAYTPFCDSRKETLGFQFWRQGFWQTHLQGVPYHISALYVVDLVRFRKFMVGDRLRAIYDNLSRDPASLANLDQDLPNYAQHIIPIHSLPQEWLWCESWCSDESKARSKTIDLCNNPLHKEPKLDMAKRVISGPLFPQSWIEMDEEIKAVIAAAAARSDAGKPQPHIKEQLPEHHPHREGQMERTEL